MKPITLKEIARAVNGKLNSENFADIVVTGVSTDSRDDIQGKIFIPFKGEHFDGHSFIREVFEKDAAASLCAQKKLNFDKPIIYVDDVKEAFMDMAEYYRSILDVRIVAVTGSTGKTTTKDIIASVLSQKYNVIKTEGNFNNEIGLPLTIFRMEEDTQYAVIEMGMSGFGEISRLSKIARPDIGVITNIGVSHIESLGNREGILRAKCEIFDYMAEDGIAVLNADDDMLVNLRGKRPNAVFYGMGAEDDFYATDIVTDGIRGVSFTLNKAGESIRINVPAPGMHNVLNSLCAAAAGTHAGLGLEQIKIGIESFRMSYMRMNIFKNKEGINIINDVYNANPASMKAAIDVLKGAEKDKLCILGDMLELGAYADRMHFEIGVYAADCNIDYILTFGEKSRFIYEGALSRIKTFNSTSMAYHFDSKKEAADYAKELLRPGDSALIKASRGMKFEEIVKELE